MNSPVLIKSIYGMKSRIQNVKGIELHKIQKHCLVNNKSIKLVQFAIRYNKAVLGSDTTGNREGPDYLSIWRIQIQVAPNQRKCLFSFFSKLEIQKYVFINQVWLFIAKIAYFNIFDSYNCDITQRLLRKEMNNYIQSLQKQDIS